MINVFYLYRTIRPKIRVLINLIFLFVHDHSTKVRSHSYFFIYSFLHWADISFCYILGITSLIFLSLCFWQYWLCISSAIFIAVLALCFLHYIHGSAALIFHTLYPWLYEVLAIGDITVNHLCILLLRSRKTNTKYYNKKREESLARNIVAS